jgi:hypothetical protein
MIAAKNIVRKMYNKLLQPSQNRHSQQLPKANKGMHKNHLRTQVIAVSEILPNTKQE